MADCCLIKKVATVEVYENKNEVRAYGFMAGDRNTPVMEVRFKHLWGESNLSSCKLRWIIVDDVGSLLVGEVPIQSDNTALINLPNELFTGDRRMKVQLTVASCDGERILNLQQFTDLKVINSLAPNEVVEPVYDILINKLYDETFRYLKQLDDKYNESVTKFTELYNANTINFTNLYDTKYASLNKLYLDSRRSLEDYMHAAENGGNANSLQGNLPRAFSRVENTIEELVNSANSKYREGDVVELLGYYTAGDGAGHKRKIEATDDGSGVQLANGLWANIVHSGQINVSWFGAKGDGITDDFSILNKAVSLAETVKIDKNLYIKQNSTINTTGRLELDFMGNTVFFKCGISTFLNSKYGITLKNGVFNFENNYLSSLLVANSEKTEIKNIEVLNIKTSPIGEKGNVALILRIDRSCRSITADNIKFKNIYGGPTSQIGTGEGSINCIYIEGQGDCEVCINEIRGEEIYNVANGTPCVGDTVIVYLAKGSENAYFERISNVYTTNVGRRVVKAQSIPRLSITNVFAIQKNRNIHALSVIGAFNSDNPDDMFGFMKELVIENVHLVSLSDSYTQWIATNGYKNCVINNVSSISENGSSTNRGISSLNLNTSISNYTSSGNKSSILISNTEGITQKLTTNIYNLNSKDSIGIESAGSPNTIVETLHDINVTSSNLYNSVQSCYIGQQEIGLSLIFNDCNIKNRFSLGDQSKSKVKNLIVRDCYINSNEYEKIETSIIERCVIHGNTVDCVTNTAITPQSSFVIIRGETQNIEVSITNNTNTRQNNKMYVGGANVQNLIRLGNLNFEDTTPVWIDSLNTPYYTAKMQQEGVYDDFIQYRDEKTEYDRLQREQPEGVMMLPVLEEPQPSEKLLAFKEKYLG